MIESEKIKLGAKLELDLMNAEHKLKIERSAELNKARIIKMQETAEMVDSLKMDAKIKLHENLSSDRGAYKQLLTDLLVQGLIKMIEPEQMLKVRKSDLELMREVVPEAVERYRDIMISEVQVLEGKSKDEVTCRVLIDDKSFLPEWNKEDQEHSCLGGFMIFAR